ncbi:MAG TPA: protein kinase [Gemmatimonadaceae bacterium]|nr:protein kinase [Gemmatimonadaceae bacterium]
MSEPLHEQVAAAVGPQYEIDGEIGRGGMSVVYRGRDRRLNRPVAIKVLPPELAHDLAIRTRFTREAQTSAQLSHAHIVPIFDVGEREGLAFIVMAIVNGGNLAMLLTREPRQPIDEVRRLLSEIADALAYAHLRGVIHRDVKPDNILLDETTGRAMVTDFGIARAIEASARLTVTGIAVGTPAYMSPEQAIGDREIDGRSDVYSLGVLGYQMLTGRLPFNAGNSMALLLKHVSETPPAITELRPDAPRSLREAIERALAKSREDRWPTAAAMREALSSDRVGAPSWRAEHREPVRYASPRPDGSRAEVQAVSPRRGVALPDVRSNIPASPNPPHAIKLEPDHLTTLTLEQRADLRLWHGRVNLMDRIKAMRGYAVLTLGAAGLGIAGFVFGLDGAPPLVLAPLVPLSMSVKLWRRGKSLRQSGLRLRRVLLMPRARQALPAPARTAQEQQLDKLASPELLESPYGAAIRRAVEDRAATLEIAAKLSKTDRAQLKELEPTTNALVERVSRLAQMVHRLDQSIDPHLADEIAARIAVMPREGASPESDRQLSLLRRQRLTLDELIQRRLTLTRQIDNAALALGNLRLDLIKLRSSGLQSAMSDVSMATQEARALSREISAVLEAAAELEKL